jgi:hypothetical protein
VSALNIWAFPNVTNGDRWPAEHAPSLSAFLELWQTQPNLQHLELNEETWNSTEKTVFTFIGVQKHTNSLRLTPKTPSGLNGSDSLLGLPIKTLHLDLRFFQPLIRGNYRINTGVVDGVSNQLFAHLRSFGRCHPLTPLVRLKLWSVDLFWCERTFLKYIDFGTLEHLELIRCPNGEAFISGVVTSLIQKPPKLRTVIIAHRQDEARNCIIREVEVFLNNAPETFEALWLSLRGHDERMLSLESIIWHASRLQKLHLDIGESSVSEDGTRNFQFYSTTSLNRLLASLNPKATHIGFPVPLKLSQPEPSVIKDILVCAFVYFVS